MNQKYCVLFLVGETGDRLVPSEEGVEASHSAISGSFTVKRIETVAVHSTIDTERRGDSRRTCSNDEHVARTTSCLESRDLEFDS